MEYPMLLTIFSVFLLAFSYYMGMLVGYIKGKARGTVEIIADLILHEYLTMEDVVEYTKDIKSEIEKNNNKNEDQ